MRRRKHRVFCGGWAEQRSKGALEEAVPIRSRNSPAPLDACSRGQKLIQQLFTLCCGARLPPPCC